MIPADATLTVTSSASSVATATKTDPVSGMTTLTINGLSAGSATINVILMVGSIGRDNANIAVTVTAAEVTDSVEDPAEPVG